MRFLRRTLFALEEMAVFILGLLASAFVAGLCYSVMPDERAGLLVFGGCLALVIVLLFLLRDRHRAWKIQYDVEKYVRELAYARAFPGKARRRRLAFHAASWLPSLFAAFVLF